MDIAEALHRAQSHPLYGAFCEWLAEDGGTPTTREWLAVSKVGELTGADAMNLYLWRCFLAGAGATGAADEEQRRQAERRQTQVENYAGFLGR